MWTPTLKLLPPEYLLRHTFRISEIDITICSDGRVLTGILLMEAGKKEPAPAPVNLHPVIVKAVKQLGEYFSGQRKHFSLPLPEFTDTFTSKIQYAISQIPYGKTLSYKELADTSGFPGAYRAAGTACGANPIPIVVPCHRVLKSGNYIGGFSSGLKIKRILLALENIKYRE